MSDIIKEIAEKQISTLPTIRKYTCTLFKDISSYKQHGTGVLTKIGTKYFLFSAAHVFDNFEELFIPLREGKTLLKPGGKIIKNNPKEHRSSDDLDVGILILDDESVTALKENYCFLDSSELQINHTPSHLLTYTIFGYPSTWSKKSISKNSFHSIPFFNFTKCVTSDEYTIFNRSERINLIVEYDRKNTPNLKSKSMSFGPDLFGISGCGLWYINPLNLKCEPTLVGIMNEWAKTNRTRLIATRIDAYTEVLRKKGIIDFPESFLFGFK